MNPDFRDLLLEFNAHQVEYLVVGAHALAAHGHVRATKDLDVWVRPDSENAKRVVDALTAFGAPLHDLTPEDLALPNVVFQIGVPPVRIDILTSVDGLTFDQAWESKLLTSTGDVPTHVLSRGALIQNKKASGRLQDQADVRWLEENGE